MDYLLISKNAQLSQEIYQIIGSSRRYIQTSLQEALSYLEERFPDVVILDVASFQEDSLRFISSLRLMHPMANILIIAITTSEDKDLRDRLFLFSNITEVDRDRLKQELTMSLEISISQHLTERSEDLPHPYTLEQMADIWREGQSGKLLLHNQRQIKLQMGGVQQLIDLPLLEEMLFQPPVHFTKEKASTTGDWIVVGDLLWNSVQKWCHPGFLRYRKWLRFIPTQQAHRAMDLDLNLQTRRLLFSTDDKQPLLNRLREKSLRIQQVEKDLESLYLLGLYTFDHVETTKIEAVGTDSPAEELVLSDEDLESFLLESITEAWNNRMAPNPWAAFFLDPHRNLSEQLQEKSLLYQRYNQVQSISAKRKVNQILSYLSTLENYLSPIVHLYQIYGFPEDPNGENETLFLLGYRYLQRQSVQDAHQAFSALPTDNIRYRAYSGWSLFLCDKSKAQEALEHLKPALISLHSSAILHCYATVIQAYLQQWKEAEHRMRTLLHKHNFEQFRSLLWYCKVKSIPDNCWVYRH